MEREVVIRFAAGPDEARPDREQVSGTVLAAGERPRSFTGWLQLLGHLEALSGVRPPEAGSEPGG